MRVFGTRPSSKRQLRLEQELARAATEPKPHVKTAAERAEGEGLPMPRRFWAIVAVSFGTALFVLDSGIANVALPTLSRELGVNEGAVTAVVTVYQLVMVMGLLPFAKLGDRIGHRRIYQIGQVLFCVASGLVWFIDSFAMLLVLRALQALGASLALAVASAMIRNIYPEKSLGSGLGVNSVVVASSAALAPTLGGYIIADFDWQYVFVVAVPFALLSLVLGRSLPNARPGADLDGTGSVWSALTVALLIGGVQLAAHGGTLVPGIVAFVAGVGSAIYLVRRERRQARPVLPVDILALPAVGLSALAAAVAFCATALLTVSLPFILEQKLGYTPDQVGLLLLPFPLTMLFFAPFTGWLSDRIAPTKLGLFGLSVLIAGFASFIFLPADGTYSDVAWRLVTCAIGFAFFMPPNSRLLIGSAPRDRAAAAGGVLSTSRLFGQANAAALAGLMLGLGLGLGPVPFYLAIALAVVAGACSLARYRTIKARNLARYVETGA